MTSEQTTEAPLMISFSSTRAAYGFLANFYSSPFTLDGRVWKTCEHYFQAQKFAGTSHEDAIRLAPSPMVAAHMGRSRQRPLRSDWEAIKEEVMLRALRAKFTQNTDLFVSLLATGSAHLVERAPRDAYWGSGPNGQGRNRLGALLEQVRTELRRGAEA
jgi:ribA/ribD-fused uncharacterized protein